MTWLFTSILDLVAGLIQQIMSIFTGDLWDAVELAKINSDLTIEGGNFDEWFPGLMQFRTIFIIMALTIVFLIFIVSLMMSMLPEMDGIQPENPLVLVGRLVVTSFSIGFCYQIMALVHAPIATVFNMVYTNGSGRLNHAPTINSGIDTDFDAGNENGFFKYATLNITDNPSEDGMGLGQALVCVFFLFAIMVAFIKLSLEVVERYITMSFLFYFAPLPFATNISSKTNQIFKSYMRMYISEGIVMIMSMCFIYIFCYAYNHPPEFVGENLEKNNIGADLVVYFAALLAWLRLGARFDELLNTMGLTTAQTGAGLGRDLMGGMYAAGGAMMMAGKAFKMGRKGASALGNATGLHPVGAAKSAATDAIRSRTNPEPAISTPNGRFSKDMSNALNSSTPVTGKQAMDMLERNLGITGMENASISKDGISITDSSGQTINLSDASSMNTDLNSAYVATADGSLMGNISPSGTNDYVDYNTDAIKSLMGDSEMYEHLDSRKDSHISGYSPGAYAVTRESDGVVEKYSLKSAYQAPEGDYEIREKFGRQYYYQEIEAKAAAGEKTLSATPRDSIKSDSIANFQKQNAMSSQDYLHYISRQQTRR